MREEMPKLEGKNIPNTKDIEAIVRIFCSTMY
jgi:hypothetical protein